MFKFEIGITLTRPLNHPSFDNHERRIQIEVNHISGLLVHVPGDPVSVLRWNTRQCVCAAYALRMPTLTFSKVFTTCESQSGMASASPERAISSLQKLARVLAFTVSLTMSL